MAYAFQYREKKQAVPAEEDLHDRFSTLDELLLHDILKAVTGKRFVVSVTAYK